MNRWGKIHLCAGFVLFTRQQSFVSLVLSHDEWPKVITACMVLIKLLTQAEIRNNSVFFPIKLTSILVLVLLGERLAGWIKSFVSGQHSSTWRRDIGL
jgi:hypothetical protein